MKKLLLILIIVSLHSEIYAQGVPLDENITFETPDSLLKIDTTAGNIWEIGRPHKIFFDSAYSLPNAIVTDTLNPYPINNFSTFTIKISDLDWNPSQPLNRTALVSDVSLIPTVCAMNEYSFETKETSGKQEKISHHRCQQH
ncbi:MAG: hypothetical protein ACHQD9_08235 [Chitinophagales bacterium]